MGQRRSLSINFGPAGTWFQVSEVSAAEYKIDSAVAYLAVFLVSGIIIYIYLLR